MYSNKINEVISIQMCSRDLLQSSGREEQDFPVMDLFYMQWGIKTIDPRRKPVLREISARNTSNKYPLLAGYNM